MKAVTVGFRLPTTALLITICSACGTYLFNTRTTAVIVVGVLTGRLAQTSPSAPNIRDLSRRCIAAVSRWNSCPELAKIATESKDAQVRATAAAALTRAAINPWAQWPLAKVAIDSPDASVRLAAVVLVTDQYLMEEIATKATDTSVGIIAVSCLTYPFQFLLAKVAMEAPDASVRIAAVAAMTDQSLLATIAAKASDASVRSAAASRKMGNNTELSAEVAVRLLDGFFREAYSDYQGTSPFNAILERSATGATSSTYVFASIDKTGYTVTSTPMTKDGINLGDPQPSAMRYTVRKITIYYHLGPSQAVSVRFADVAKIDVSKRLGAAEYATLLNARGDTLGGFSLSGHFYLPTGQPVVPPKTDDVLLALSTLCRNLK
jgi:hypothetical protein